MTEQKITPISLTDQIMDTLFSSLENQEGFNNDLIDRLRDLASHGELTKSAKVAGVLKTIKGGDDEAY